MKAEQREFNIIIHVILIFKNHFLRQYDVLVFPLDSYLKNFIQSGQWNQKISVILKSPMVLKLVQHVASILKSGTAQAYFVQN